VQNLPYPTVLKSRIGDLDYVRPPALVPILGNLFLTWKESYKNLQVFKETYGHCDVPRKFKHNLKGGTYSATAYFVHS
jgi:hypothetical protein